MELSKITAKFQTTLAAECLDDDTTFTITSVVDGTGNNISGKYSFTIDEGTDYEEFISGTVASSTGVVTGLSRGLDYSNPLVSVNALKKDHYRGAIVKVTDYTVLAEVRSVLNGENTIENVLQYGTYALPTEDTDLVSKKYVDDSIVVSTGDVTGPSSAIDLRIAVFDSTTGKLIKDGGKTIAEVIAGSLDPASISDINIGTEAVDYITPYGIAGSDYKKQAEILAYRLDEFGATNDNTDLNSSTSSHGLLLKLSGSTTEFLRADGQWITPTGTGDVVGPSSSETNNLAAFGSTTGKALVDSGYTIAELLAEVPSVATGSEVDTGTDNSKYISSLALANSTYKTLAEIQAIKLDDFSTPDDNTDLNSTTSWHGLLKKLSGSATEYLNGAGNWSTPASLGDVVGPGSATDLNIAVFDSTTGKLIKDGGKTIAELLADIAVKASYTEINTGTNDTKFATPLGLQSSNYVKRTGTFEANNVSIFSDTTGKEIEDGGYTVVELLARANHTGTQTASSISDFDTEVLNNSGVALNTTHRTSDGSDHTFIDQSVISGSDPTFGDITADSIDGVDPSALEDISNEINSPSTATGGEISEGTNAGTFKVSAMTAILRTTNAEDGKLLEVSLAEQDNQAITTANTMYYVCFDYNGGTPQIVLSESISYFGATPDYTQIPLGRVEKDSSDNVHFISGGFNFQDVNSKVLRQLLERFGFGLVSGGTIAYSGTNNFTSAALVGYGGVNRFTTDAYNSAVTQFTPVYSDGSAGWTYGATRNTIDYAHYDDGDGTLGAIGNNRYGCHWVYRHVDDGHVYVVYGTDSYTLADAESAPIPSIPDTLTDFGVLIGCIIAPKNGGSFTTIQMATDRMFSGSSPSDHNELANIDGGEVGAYYHLTLAKYNIANTSTASFLTADETKLDFLTVTQAVNLDTMESNIASNNAFRTTPSTIITAGTNIE